MSGKVLLINQSLSEVSAFHEEQIPYVAVYVHSCSEQERVESYQGRHSHHVNDLIELASIKEARECSYIASYRDASAKLCNQAQRIMKIDSNCHNQYFNFFHDKFRMNEVLSKLGQTRHFGELNINAVNSFPGPDRYIFKPRSLQGSLGVREFFINSSPEWDEKCRKYLSDRLRASCEDGYLWERYACGQEYSVDVYVHQKTIHLLGFARKGTNFDGNFVESSHLVGDVLEPRLADTILVSLNQIFAEVGYQSGPAHVEFKIDEHEQIHLIEFHPRPGGDNLIELIWMAKGVSLVDHLLCHLNGKVPIAKPTAGHFAMIQYLQENPTSDCSARLMRFPELKVKTSLSDSVKIESSRDRPAYVMSKGLPLSKLASIMGETRSDVSWDQYEYVLEKARCST